MINVRGSVVLVLALLAFVLIVSKARADTPCPPQKFFCWQVKAAVELLGEDYLEQKVRACKWPEHKITEAKRCLRK